MARMSSFGKKSSAESHEGYGITKSAAFAFALLVADAILVSLIIYFIPYTKIDWDAYMAQVDGFLGGERDYRNLKGDTGPLVYPAGFLYVYSAIKFVTGGMILPAQALFGVLYIVNLGIVFLIYEITDVLPWWAFVLLCLSKRVHSIFMLRLFNDCVAMTLLHAALAFLLHQKWHCALIIFSCISQDECPPFYSTVASAYVEGSEYQGNFIYFVVCCIAADSLGFAFFIIISYGVHL